LGLIDRHVVANAPFDTHSTGMWATEFPDRQPAHFVFPSERYGLIRRVGEFGGSVKPYDYNPNKAVSTIQHASGSAKKRTQRHCPVCDGTLLDQEKPATGYICDACRFETPHLPAGLIAVRFHDMRHTAVSLLISARVPLPIIAKIVGWSTSTTAKMVSRYGHFGTEELCGAVDSISTGEKAEVGMGYPRNPPQ